jgi:3-methylcrotonyl-CoA carboxylase beta subunit
MVRELIAESNYSSRVEPIWNVLASDTFLTENSAAKESVLDREPLYAIEDLEYILPCDNHDIGKDEMEAVVGRLLDGSELKEFKSSYGKSLLTGFGHLHGHPVGVIANIDPQICAQGARKGAQFVSLCDQREVPILFVQNIHGVAPRDLVADSGGGGGGGVLKSSAMMMRAVATSRVPSVTLIVGDSAGGGNFLMGGRSMAPSFVYMWPGAKIGMESEAGCEEESSNTLRGAMYSTGRLWDDGVLSFHSTRKTIALSLAAASYRLRKSPLDESFHQGSVRRSCYGNNGRGTGVFRM